MEPEAHQQRRHWRRTVTFRDGTHRHADTRGTAEGNNSQARSGRAEAGSVDGTLHDALGVSVAAAVPPDLAVGRRRRTERARSEARAVERTDDRSLERAVDRSLAVGSERRLEDESVSFAGALPAAAPRRATTDLAPRCDGHAGA